MKDVIIIGSGPAGVSAAIYLKRQNINVSVFTTHDSSLMRASEVENYYGIEKISGNDLYNNGLLQLKGFGIELLEEEVVDIKYEGEYVIKTATGIYRSRSVIFATGVNINKVSIPGITDFEGRGVSYCATCDAYFFKNKKIGLLGSGDFAVSELEVLRNVTDDIYVFTNGDLGHNFKGEVITAKVSEVYGDGSLKGVKLENGEIIELDGLFIASGIAGSFAFSKKLGVSLEGNYIAVSSEYATNVPGLYAIGDARGGFLQVSTAVGEGAIVSREVIKYLKGIKNT